MHYPQRLALASILPPVHLRAGRATSDDVFIMKPTRIEELVEEFKDKFGVTYGGQETQDEWIRTALTEAHQAGINEAVEKLRENKLEHPYTVHYTACYVCKANKALDDTIKALQDKK